MDAATAAAVAELFAAIWFARAAVTTTACRLAWPHRGRYLGPRIPREVLLALLPERDLALSEW